MNENDISYLIRGAVFDVYKNLGPGLLESVYEEALVLELKKRNLSVERQKNIPIKYDDIVLTTPLRLDLIVENKVIVELKSVEELKPVFFKQLLTYLKLSNKRLGLLVNFNVEDIFHKAIHRIIN